MSTCVSGSTNNECNFCCIKINWNYLRFFFFSDFTFDLFRLRITAVNHLDTILLFGWEMRSVKCILHNDDNEGRDDDDDDDDDDTDKRKKLPLIV
jgi:hypothetical protein